MRTGRPTPAAEIGLPRPDGTLIWVLVSACPLIEDGELVGAVATLSDHTARRDVERAERTVSSAMQVLVRAVDEQALLRESLALERAKSRLDLLEKYTRGRTVKELEGDVEQKQVNLLAKKSFLELAIAKEQKCRAQLEKCDLYAPSDGIVVYANDRVMGPIQPRIEEGATLEAPCFIDTGAHVKAGAVIGPYSVIGRAAVIEEDATIKSTIIWPNTRIGQHAEVDGAILGRNCHLGRNVVIRGSAVLGDKTALTEYTSLQCDQWPH